VVRRLIPAYSPGFSEAIAQPFANGELSDCDLERLALAIGPFANPEPQARCVVFRVCSCCDKQMLFAKTESV
jgi:hypothetical protein